MALHLFTDLVDKGGFVYTYIGHFICLLYVSISKAHVCTSPLTFMCLYECGVFRSYDNDYHSFFSEI